MLLQFASPEAEQTWELRRQGTLCSSWAIVLLAGRTAGTMALLPSAAARRRHLDAPLVTPLSVPPAPYRCVPSHPLHSTPLHASCRREPVSARSHPCWLPQPTPDSFCVCFMGNPTVVHSARVSPPSCGAWA